VFRAGGLGSQSLSYALELASDRRLPAMACSLGPALVRCSAGSWLLAMVPATARSGLPVYLLAELLSSLMFNSVHDLDRVESLQPTFGFDSTRYESRLHTPGR
jgi:hypothetical protein